MKKTILALALLESALCANAQQTEEADPLKPFENITYKVEMQGTLSDDVTPLWLNANRHGLSSLDKTNGYLRGALVRPLQVDEERKWGLGYGLDLAVAKGFTSRAVVQQAFAELRWLHAAVTAGSKEWPMELKNPCLSTGSQTLGINARPVPQVRGALPDYWTVPGTGGWIHIKGHVAYGKLTDQNWQHDFTQRQTKYADDALFHSKAGYLKIGNPERFKPWSLELGLEMATTFGGTCYMSGNREGGIIAKGGTGLSDFWNAFLPGGAEQVEKGTAYENAEGNQLGSWVGRLNYEADTWRFSIYGDKFFEDHSQLFQVDYDGYGTGDEWNVSKRRHYFLYDLKDMMLGLELSYKYDRPIREIVFEYINTKYQSGPIYHDHTPGLSDHIGGWDNYYNHYVYTGWQHWGQHIGNPLYRSPIYNTDGNIRTQNNRFTAFHLGIDGNISQRLTYRLLATYQDGLGTYEHPYTKKRKNVSLMAEATYRLPHGYSLKAACGLDAGTLLGSNRGLQLTFSKTGIINKEKEK